MGAVNGALGTVVGFHYYTNTTATPAQQARDLGLRSCTVLETAASEIPPLPVVLVNLDRFNGRSYVPELGDCVVPVFPVQSRVRLGGRTYIRNQVPLILAKAITIHKSQGQSLNSVVFDPAALFAKGMAYVEISRAKRLKVYT